MTTVIQNLPTPPAPSDTPSDFNSKAFSILGALPQFVTEANLLGSELTQASEDAANNAEAARLSKEAAAGSSQAAGTHAGNASISAGQAAGSAGSASADKEAAELARDAARGYAESIDPANLLKRANHTGTQSIETVEGLVQWQANPTGVQSINGGQLAGMRNKILNGLFNINQSGAASRTAAVGYNYDQWYYDGTYLYQPVPWEDIEDGVYTLSWEGNSTAAWSHNIEGATAQGGQIYTPVVKGGQINIEGASRHLWVRFESDLANLNKVQLEPGAVATPFEQRPFSLEKLLCKYFYEYGSYYFRGYDLAGGIVGGTKGFSIEKRGVPTIILLPFSYSNAAGAFTTNITTSDFGVYTNVIAAGGAQGFINWTALARI